MGAWAGSLLGERSGLELLESPFSVAPLGPCPLAVTAAGTLGEVVMAPGLWLSHLLGSLAPWSP